VGGGASGAGEGAAVVVGDPLRFDPELLELRRVVALEEDDESDLELDRETLRHGSSMRLEREVIAAAPGNSLTGNGAR